MTQSPSNKFEVFYNQFHYLLRIFLLTMAIFTIARLAFVFFYKDDFSISDNLFEVIKAFVIGLRFDTTVTLYGLFLPFLLISSLLFVPVKFTKFPAFVKKFVFYFSIVVFVVFTLIVFIDLYFFKFFQFHINILFFGIIHDDTLAVLRSVWTDYPVIKITLSITALVFIYSHLLKRIFQKQYSNFIHSTTLKSASYLVLFFCIFVGMRGSLSTFPIQNEDTLISDNTFINNITVNGVFALKSAIEDNNKQKISTDIEQKLKENGFNSASEAVKTYLGNNNLKEDELLQAMLSRTPENEFLEKNPPHVIFIQMESFGSYYLDLHSPSLNLLGQLEGQLKDCILFRNFLSCTTGTIHTLEGLIAGTPLTPISQSVYLDRGLSSSVALPYKNAGYNTTYVTSGELGWRNIDQFVKYQYFQNAEGCETLFKKVPGTTRGQWGAYDEYMFERMFQILKESKQPQFVYAMSITNHTPFELPEHYKPYPINIPSALEKRIKTKHDIAVKNFTNYQYANDCLGRFIEMVKNSEFGDNTIIVASGDHNTLQLFNYDDKHLKDKYSVPFLLYVPEKYMPKTEIDTQQFGSHKDIFPTLFNLSLSNATYVNTGVNMLEKHEDNFAIISYNVAMNKYGCVLINEKRALCWTNDTRKYLNPTAIEQHTELSSLLLKSRAYKAAMTYYIQSDLKRAKK